MEELPAQILFYISQYLKEQDLKNLCQVLKLKD